MKRIIEFILLIPVFTILGLAIVVFTIEVYVFTLLYWYFRPKYIKTPYYRYCWNMVSNFAKHLFEL